MSLSKIFSWFLQDFSSLYNSNYYGDKCNNKQNMNDSSCMKCKETDQPSDYEDNCNDVQYVSHKIYFKKESYWIHIQFYNDLCPCWLWYPSSQLPGYISKKFEWWIVAVIFCVDFDKFNFSSITISTTWYFILILQRACARRINYYEWYNSSLFVRLVNIHSIIKN